MSTLPPTPASIGDAQGDTFSGIDKVIGSSFSDGLFADDSGMVLDGGAGDDLLVGGAGLDVLTGGDGSDTLEGGRGLDVLTGGAGADYSASAGTRVPISSPTSSPASTRSFSTRRSRPCHSAPISSSGPERKCRPIMSGRPRRVVLRHRRPSAVRGLARIGIIRAKRMSRCWRHSRTACNCRRATSFLGSGEPSRTGQEKSPAVIGRGFGLSERAFEFTAAIRRAG